MMGMEIESVLFHPFPQKISNPRGSRNQAGKEKNVTRPVNAQRERREFHPRAHQNFSIADKALRVGRKRGSIDASDRGRSNNVGWNLSIVKSHEHAGLV